VPFLPFGFPIIADSLDKEYTFELESLRGNPRNAVIVSSQYPRLQSKYVTDLGEIKSDPNALIEYFKQKYIGAFDNPSVVFSSLIYALPLIFYLAWLTGLIKQLLKPFPNQIRWFEKRLNSLKNKETATVFVSLTLFSVVYDIFIIQLTNDMAYIIIVALWLTLFKIFKLENRFTFGVGLIILIISAISNTVMFEAVAEKSAAWAFMFFVTGTIQIFRQIQIGK
jgi:hypothetical protein